MKKRISILCATLLLIVLNFPTFGQHVEGKFVVKKFSAPSIEGNRGGENPVRRLSVYLPPGYSESRERYPVIYFLHGYGVNDSLMVEWLGLKKIMDKAIASKRIKPVILVLPNSDNRYMGSFYTNSSLTGNWAAFVARDVVEYVDKNFRTLAKKESRGLCGHSMGGHGALKIAMLYPGIFSGIYALSPGALHWSKEFHLNNKAFKNLASIKDESQILKPLNEPSSPDDQNFWTPLLASMGRAFTPDEKVVPHQAKLPVSYTGDTKVINVEVLRVWESNFPINMIVDHMAGLKELKGLKIDWGRDDEFPHIPATCRELSDKLEAFGIKHYAEEYIGRHENKLGGWDGRIFTDVLPFFEDLFDFTTHSTGKP